MEYKDFNIRISNKRDNGYDVSVDSPQGSANEHIILPFDIEETLGRIRQIGGTVRGDATREATFESEDVPTPNELGKELYDALFSGAIGKMYQRSYAALSDNSEVGLRIKLHLNLDDPGVSALAQIPWEFAYESDTMEYLTLSRQTPIVRFIEVQRKPTQHALPVMLRILVVMSSPNGVASLDLEKERTLIEQSWAGESNVEVDFLEHPTPDKLLSAVVEKQYHVLHYMGHGAYDPKTGAGALILEDENQNAVMLDAQTLGTVLRDAPSIRLVFLNACDTARTDEDQPFSGVANRLVMAGVPAVLAMQFPITDKAAIDFARVFYPRLVEGYPVDEATSQGRKAILAGRSGTIEWGTPVLYLRMPDGRLFDRQDEPVAPTPPPATSTPAQELPTTLSSINPKAIAAVLGLALVAIAAYFLLQPKVEWKIDPQELSVGVETLVSVKQFVDDDREVSYTDDYDLELLSSGPLTKPVHEKRWTWWVTATDVDTVENPKALLTLEVSAEGDSERVPITFPVTIKVSSLAQRSYNSAIESVNDSSKTTAEVANALADVKKMYANPEQDFMQLSVADGDVLNSELANIDELLALRASKGEASANEELTLTARIIALTEWKSKFEQYRYELSEGSNDALYTRLLDYQQRQNADSLVLCNRYNACDTSITRLRMGNGLYVQAEPNGDNLKCQIIGPETRRCDVNKNAYRLLNKRGEYFVEIRNSTGDLLLKQAIESY